ncbi:hypothetical protein X755_15945 [Mesorhizobium sp. LNJC405B00]|nr:hypothetical protein X755_15945 [Mesorhizobium sp. LNJC405B00]
MIALCSTDDRYNDDIHYLGRAQMRDNLDWDTTAWAIAMAPPSISRVGMKISSSSRQPGNPETVAFVAYAACEEFKLTLDCTHTTKAA